MILGIGGASWDEILYIDELPRWNENFAVKRREAYPGGMVATALAAATRLGADTAIAGLRGDDDAGERLEKALKNEGIALEEYRTVPGNSSSSVILVKEDGGQRSILNSRGVQARNRLEQEKRVFSLAQRAQWIHLDGHYTESLLDILPRLEDPRPVISLDPSSLLLSRKDTPELIACCDYLMPSRSWAGRYTGKESLEEIFEVLLPMPRKGLIVTDGTRGSYFAESGDRTFRHKPAFSIEAMDTTGAGDAFHGAFAASLAEGYSLEEGITRASAAAALNCMGRGAQEGLPDRDTLEHFLKKSGL